MDINQFRHSYAVIRDFNPLIKKLCDINDVKGLTTTLQYLKLVKSTYQLEGKYSDLNFKKRLGNALTETETIELAEIENLYWYIFSIQFGNLSWLYYRVFELGEDPISNKALIVTLESYLTIDSNTLVKFTSDAISKLANSKEFLWDKWIWRSESRLDGEVYSLENASFFICLGFIIALQKAGTEALDQIQLQLEEVNNLVFLTREVIQRYDSDNPSWRFAFGAENTEEVGAILQRINAFLDSLVDRRNVVRNRDLVNEPLSATKIEEFRRQIKSQWEKSRVVEKVLEFFDSVTHNPEEKLRHVGMMRINFQGAKIMFVDRFYQKIYNIEWGHQVNDRVHDLFIDELVHSKEIVAEQVSSIVEVLDKIIDEELPFNILFISIQNWSEIYRNVIESGNFAIAQENQYPFPFAGIYKQKLIVIPVKSEKFNKNVIAVKLPGAIKLKQRLHNNWIEKKLQVDVNEITSEVARDMLVEANPNADVTDESLLDKIRTGILIEVNETIDFEVLDKKLVKKYTTKPIVSENKTKEK